MNTEPYFNIQWKKRKNINNDFEETVLPVVAVQL